MTFKETFKKMFEPNTRIEKKGVRVTRFECVKPDWIRVVNAARRTVGKKPINREPSEVFMFDGPSFYAVSKVFVWVLNDTLKDKVIID